MAFPFYFMIVSKTQNREIFDFAKQNSEGNELKRFLLAHALLTFKFKESLAWACSKRPIF